MEQKELKKAPVGTEAKKKRISCVDPDDLIGEISDAVTEAIHRVLDEYDSSDVSAYAKIPLDEKKFCIMLNRSKNRKLRITLTFEKVNCD